MKKRRKTKHKVTWMDAVNGGNGQKDGRRIVCMLYVVCMLCVILWYVSVMHVVCIILCGVNVCTSARACAACV